MEKEKRRKMGDLVISIFMVTGLTWMYFDFEYFFNPGFMPSGKGVKIMILVNNFLNKLGGKYFTILVLTALVSPFIYRSVRNLFKKDAHN